jgi:hypothetical protein
MAKQNNNKQQRTVAASELVAAAKAGFVAQADAFAGSLAAMLAALGVVSVTAHPSSVPQQPTGGNSADASARVNASAGNGRKAQTAGLPTLPTRPRALGHVGRAEESIADRITNETTRPASVTPEVPSVTVSDKYRTILPKVLFDAGEGQKYTHILVTFPDGTEQQINTNDEGRGRCPSSWFGVDAGHVAYFHEIDNGVYQVNVSGRTAHLLQTGDLRRTRQTPASSAGHASRVTPDTDIDAALELAFAAPGGGKGNKRPSKPPTAAQAAARERFATETRVIKCAECGERVKIGETADGICAKHTVDPLPRKVTRGTSPVVAGGTRTEAASARVTPHFAASEGVSDTSSRGTRMKARAAELKAEKERERVTPRAEARETAARLQGLPVLPRRR